ncbi:proteasome accessory factor PafA2 family protein [Haliangium sp.]|uniref:proteasome accessory factor PafA2 family protein n=1 Tax=Haliangium sp. TaxID=2663208 RepID=UPI003D14E6A9
MLRRLLGLESEYAIRFTSLPGSESPDNNVVYGAVREAIGDLVLTRKGDWAREQFFVENGGAFAYEYLPTAPDGGLVEGATPECRGPEEGLLYQCAQRALLIQALPAAEHILAHQGYRGSLGLLENCRDAEGHVYGAQENFEADIGTGPTLWLWRAGVAALIPIILVCAVVSWVSFVALAVSWLVLLFGVGLAAVVSPSLRRSGVPAAVAFTTPSRRIVRALGRIEYVLYGHVLWAPVLWPFFALFRLVAFRRVRRDGLAFLMSRPVLSGAGTLDDEGVFGLSEKGPTIRRVVRLWVGQHDRAVFDAGNLCKAALRVAYLDLRSFLGLFRRRQRMQLGLADANPAQVAGYLKLATTALVIDMAEAGALAGLPRLRRPVEALRHIISDPSLQAEVEVVGGSPMRALDIQRAYLERARAFVDQAEVTSIEAVELLALWQRTLDALDALARGEHEVSESPLLGQLDWITKRYLLDTAGRELSPAARKKIDLKYHELGGGYFARLDRAGLVSHIWSPDEIAQAMHDPPSPGSARARSRMIRELGRRQAKVRVSWDRIRVGKPFAGKVIRLDEHR